MGNMEKGNVVGMERMDPEKKAVVSLPPPKSE